MTIVIYGQFKLDATLIYLHLQIICCTGANVRFSPLLLAYAMQKRGLTTLLSLLNCLKFLKIILQEKDNEVFIGF